MFDNKRKKLDQCDKMKTRKCGLNWWQFGDQKIGGHVLHR